jgi:5' nucleotidase, deoxy (Pyrimidine), cytosolic type C protein (NT5C)
MRVGIDLDGCVYDFVEACRQYVAVATGRPLAELERYPRTYRFPTEWGIAWEDFNDLWKAGVENGYIWRVGVPLPGSCAAIHAIRERGHTVHLVTHRNNMPAAERLAQANTEAWLYERGIPYDTITYAEDKTVAKVDMFLDDKPSNVDALRAAGVEAWLLHRNLAPHDWQDQAGHPYLIRTWDDFIEKVDARAIHQVIALSGYAESGKDTVAAILVADYGFERRGFADRLKGCLYALNPLTGNGKRVQHVVDYAGWDNAKKYGEIRELLQRLGTEAGRRVLGDDVWVRAALMDPPAKLVLSDCRFPNEAEAIKALGGQVWRIERPGYNPINSHVSEVALDGYPFDQVINNDGSIEDLIAKVGKALAG